MGRKGSRERKKILEERRRNRAKGCLPSLQTSTFYHPLRRLRQKWAFPRSTSSVLISHQQQNAEQTQILAARSTSGILGVLDLDLDIVGACGGWTATTPPPSPTEDEAEFDFMALVVNGK